jgi:hypothetical protein
VIDYLTLLTRRYTEKIIQQEDDRILTEFSMMLWDDDDKWRGNVLRYFKSRDYVSMKRVSFFTHLKWAIESPFRRHLHELYNLV